MKTDRLLALVILLLAHISGLTFAACGSSGTEAQFSSEELAKMDAVVRDAMKTGNIPGVIAAVIVGGRGEWSVAAGTADTAAGGPVKITDKTRAGSVTKMFTSTVMLQLADEARLSLDDPVSKYLPEIPNGENIPIRQLLNMSSGLFDFAQTDGFTASVAHNPLKEWTPLELITLGVTNPRNPIFAPGTGFYYSNTNYVALGMIIEKVTANTLVNEIRTRIVEPLGLKNTFLPEQAEMPNGSMHGYYPSPEDGGAILDLTVQNPSYCWAAGAVVSDLEDLIAFIRAVGDGTLLSPQMQRERLTIIPYRPGDNVDGYGLGISIINGFIGHNGSLLGYNTSAYYFPAKDTVIVVLTNEWKIPNLRLGSDTIFINLAKVVLPELDWTGLE